MTQPAARFGGLYFRLVDGWCDVTHELPPGSPQTLAKPEGGVGALQFSGARYTGGRRPEITALVLREMLAELSEAHGLGAPRNVRELDGDCRSLRADFSRDEAFTRVWYLTNRLDIVMATYSAEEPRSALLDSEIEEADRMLTTARLL